MNIITKNKKQRRARRIRAKIHGTAKMPRLCVHRTNSYVYAQLIDDDAKATILGISQKTIKPEKGNKSEIAKLLGVAFAKMILEKKIKTVVFDKGSYAYHGRVKAFAEGAREGGLTF